ncbi:MAG: Smr/MutS family protein [Sphingomonadales bacterium]|nr:Smr/MutS family protein [Sphingomonadales bacterium]MBK9587329.1 Smr/MutS family protein [Sphingomonadales bacterium]MBP7135281.1 Smr/MutS family protein [Sphingomonadaceae bacterium]
MSRRLSPEERAVWRRVTETVSRAGPRDPVETERPVAPAKAGAQVKGRRPSVKQAPAFAGATHTPHSANTLDGGWDKRIAKGTLEPDFTIDLHGETLASAHAKLNRALSLAIRNEARILLLITGKAARDNPRLPPTTRGVIRASVKDWLAASQHSAHIAAIRGAHPRHGGAGALYVILRRGR